MIQCEVDDALIGQSSVTGELKCRDNQSRYCTPYRPSSGSRRYLTSLSSLVSNHNGQDAGQCDAYGWGRRKRKSVTHQMLSLNGLILARLSGKEKALTQDRHDSARGTTNWSLLGSTAAAQISECSSKTSCQYLLFDKPDNHLENGFFQA